MKNSLDSLALRQLKYFSFHKSIKIYRSLSNFSRSKSGLKKTEISFLMNNDILNETSLNSSISLLHAQNKRLQSSLFLIKIDLRLFSSSVVLKNKINRENLFNNTKVKSMAEPKTILSKKNKNKLKETNSLLNSISINSDTYRIIPNKNRTLLSNSWPSSSERALLNTHSNKNLLPLNTRLTEKEYNNLLISRYNTNIFGRKILKLTEKDWKDRWLKKINKFIDLGLYSPDSSDKLFFSYLNDKKQYLKSKYTFNEFLSGSQIITYKFNKYFKKIDLNYIYKILHSFFKKLDSLISNPYIEITPEKVKIRLFYYVLPSITKKIIHQSLHRYIRSDEKLYKELILRRKFKSIMEKFKLKLFIAKWKEDKYFIVSPSPIYFIKGFTFEDLYKIKSLKDGSNLSIKPISSSASDKVSQLNLIPRFYDERGAGEVRKYYGYNTPLNIFKLDLFKLTQQHELLKSFFGLMFKNKIQDILLNQSERESYLASLHKSLLKEIKKENEAKLKIKKDNKENFFKKTNISIDENSDKESPSLQTLISESVSDNTSIQLETLPELIYTKAPEIHSKDSSAISKDKNIEDLETEIVNSSSQQTKIIQIQGLSNASLTKLKDGKLPTIVSLNKEKFKYLIYILEKLFKKTILLELVKLKYPYHESHILAQVLGLSSTNKNFRKLMLKLLYTANISNPTNKILKQNFPIIPSYLSGLKVKLAGRLITQRVVPRFTVQSFQIGSLARGKINFMNNSRITLKNKRGAFSFTVITSHIFNK